MVIVKGKSRIAALFQVPLTCKMKLSGESDVRPKYVLDRVYRSLGHVSHVRSAGQIPRRPQDIYNGRRSVPSEKVGSTENPVVKLDSLWLLLERALREEENPLQERFICECCIHPDFFSSTSK